MTPHIFHQHVVGIVVFFWGGGLEETVDSISKNQLSLLLFSCCFFGVSVASSATW